MSLQNLNNPSGGGSGGSGLSSVSADAPLSGSGTSGSHLVIANASGAAVGVIQLAGDLGGTATSPTVTNLSHVINPSLLPILGGHTPNPLAAAGAGRIEINGGAPFTASSAVSTGIAFFSEFTAPATETLANLQIYMNTAAVIGAGSITLAQLILCSVSGTTYSSIGVTANDSTILTGGGLTTKAIASGSGAVTQGSRYSIGIVTVYASLTTSPTAIGIGVVQGFTNKTGYPAMSGQATSSSASVAGTTTYTALATARYFWFGATN